MLKTIKRRQLTLSLYIFYNVSQFFHYLYYVISSKNLNFEFLACLFYYFPIRHYSLVNFESSDDTFPDKCQF